MRAVIERLPVVTQLGIVFALVLFAALFLSAKPEAHAANTIPLAGYAWSDAVGWISVSGNNYGLIMDANGTVTGYAWSDNVGWISANSADIAPCQSGASSRIQNGTWVGWMRAIAGGSGGWDGCISMSGSGYGVSYDKHAGTFGGYAWGDVNLGWIDFSQVSTSGQCTVLQGDNYCVGNAIYQHDVQGNACQVSTCSYQCNNGACVAPPAPQAGFADNNALHVDPSVVQSGQTSIVSWSIKNVKGNCTVVGTNGDSWSSTADPSNNSAGSRTSSTLTTQVSYTLTCTGLDNSTYTETKTINIIPKFREL